jgi:type IV secretory pathway TrbD component
LSHEVPGYYAPVRRSLTQPMLVAGVPSKVAIGLGMAAALFVAAWHVYALLPVLVVAYAAAVAACKRDPHIFSIIHQNRGQYRYLP